MRFERRHSTNFNMERNLLLVHDIKQRKIKVAFACSSM